LDTRRRNAFDGAVQCADSELNRGEAMKALTVLAAFLLLSLPALAQTQTNCQVYGNQINCTTTSPPAIPPPPVVHPVLSPELINALAEKQAQEFAARQAAVQKFEAELSGPDVWMELRTGGQFHVRMLKERIYLLWIPDPNTANGNRFSAECQPADSGFTCASSADRVQITWNNWRMRWDRKSCHSDGNFTLTSVALDRIQYQNDSAVRPQDFDFKTCAAKRGAAKTQMTFTLIPREAPKP
jgi:hypothetical protein